MKHHCCLLREKPHKAGRETLALEMTVDLGKDRVEKLQVRTGELPGAAARAFCARYKLPQRLESVLADAIETNLRAKQHTDRSATEVTPTRSRTPADSTFKENLTPPPLIYPNPPSDPKSRAVLPNSASGHFPVKPTPPQRPPLKPEFPSDVLHKIQQDRYADIYQALKYPGDPVLRSARVRTSLVHSELLALLEPLLGELRDLGETLSLPEFQASMSNLAAVLSSEERRVLFFPFEFPRSA